MPSQQPSTKLVVRWAAQAFLTPTHLAIAMEYASGGELFGYLAHERRFTENKVGTARHPEPCQACACVRPGTSKGHEYGSRSIYQVEVHVSQGTKSRRSNVRVDWPAPPELMCILTCE